MLCGYQICNGYLCLGKEILKISFDLYISSDQLLTFHYLQDYIIFKTYAFVCMCMCTCILCIRVCGIWYISYSVEGHGHGTVYLYHKHINFL